MSKRIMLSVDVVQKIAAQDNINNRIIDLETFVFV